MNTEPKTQDWEHEVGCTHHGINEDGNLYPCNCPRGRLARERNEAQKLFGLVSDQLSIAVGQREALMEVSAVDPLDRVAEAVLSRMKGDPSSSTEPQLWARYAYRVAQAMRDESAKRKGTQ